MLKIELDDGEIHHGSTIRGRVIVTLERPTRCREVTVRLTAKAVARTQVQRIREGDKLPFTYTDDCRTMWRPDTGETDTLQQGEHRFSFQFKLCPMNPFPGVFAHIPITHTLTARMELGQFKSHSTDRWIQVKERPDVETVETEPQTAQKVKHLALNGGTITLSASIPRTGYSSGESVPHKVSIDNNTSKTLQVFSTLLGYQTLHADPTGTPLILSSAQSNSLCQTINPREKCTFELGIVLPVQTMVNFSHHYMLMVTARVPWRSNMNLTLPLLYKKDLNLLQTSAATAMGISPSAMAQMYQQAAQYIGNSGAMPLHMGASPFGGLAQYSGMGMPQPLHTSGMGMGQPLHTSGMGMGQPPPSSGMGMPQPPHTSGMGMGPTKPDDIKTDYQPSTNDALRSQEDPPPYSMAVKS